MDVTGPWAPADFIPAADRTVQHLDILPFGDLHDDAVWQAALCRQAHPWGDHTGGDEIYINVGDSMYETFNIVYPKWQNGYTGYFKGVRFLEFYLKPIDMDLSPKGMDLNKVNKGIKAFLALTQKDNVTTPPMKSWTNSIKINTINK